MLDGDGLVLVLDRLFNRDDMHADAVAAGRDQVRFALERQEGHFVECIRELGVFLDLPEHHVRHLGDAGDEELDIPLLLVLRILPVVLHDAVHGGVGEQLLDPRLGLAGELCDLRGGLGLAQAHFQHDRRDLIVGTGAVENGVLRVVLGQTLETELVGEAVGDHFAKIKQNLSCHSFFSFRYRNMNRSIYMNSYFHRIRLTHKA